MSGIYPQEKLICQNACVSNPNENLNMIDHSCCTTVIKVKVLFLYSRVTPPQHRARPCFPSLCFVQWDHVTSLILPCFASLWKEHGQTRNTKCLILKISCICLKISEIIKLKHLDFLFLDNVFVDVSYGWDPLLTAMLPFCQAVMERSLWPSEESQSTNTSGCTLPPLTAVKEITLVDSLWIFVIFSHSKTSFKYLVWVDLRCIWHQLYQTLGEPVHQLHLDLWKDLWHILLICWSCSILFTLLRCTGMHLQGVIW